MAWASGNTDARHVFWQRRSFSISLFELEATLNNTEHRTPWVKAITPHSLWKRAHHDWRFWIGLVLMLAQWGFMSGATTWRSCLGAGRRSCGSSQSAIAGCGKTPIHASFGKGTSSTRAVTARNQPRLPAAGECCTGKTLFPQPDRVFMARVTPRQSMRMREIHESDVLVSPALYGSISTGCGETGRRRS